MVCARLWMDPKALLGILLSTAVNRRQWQVQNNGTGQLETVEPLVKQICEFDSIKKEV